MVDKIENCISDEALEKLRTMRDNLLQPVFLNRMPNTDRFTKLFIKQPDDSFWETQVGKECEIIIRYQKKFRARLLSVTYRKIKNLTAGDALAAGYSFGGLHPKEKMKLQLARRLKQSPYWQGDETELKMLSFRRTENVSKQG